jgi:sulfate adenylyltransferase subunit 2
LTRTVIKPADQASGDTPLTLDQLNERRRRAVQLRLTGCSLPQIRAQTGLSAPTIIGAYKAFLRQGWHGIAIAGRGRQAGQGRIVSPADEARLRRLVLDGPPEAAGLPATLWTPDAAARLAVVGGSGLAPTSRALARLLNRMGLSLATMAASAASNPLLDVWRKRQLPALVRQARRQHATLVWCGQIRVPGPSPSDGRRLLVAQTLRGSVAWLPLHNAYSLDAYLDFLGRLRYVWPGHHQVLLHGIDLGNPGLQAWQQANPRTTLHPCPAGPALAHPTALAQAAPAAPGTCTADVFSAPPSNQRPASTGLKPMKLTHLQRLEAESIHIMREVVAEATNPVMLYSVGKDSATMLHLAKKAFYPSPPPFPLLHVDTTWKFRDMYALRDRMAAEMGMTLLTYRNPEAEAKGINPFDHGSQIHTDMWKTEGLKQALDLHGFDVAFGGARRDEEKSRAKERIFSFRSAQHRWDPKFQRPELWNLYNARKHPGESIRVFPISNWTELDIWQYIYLENIPIVPLYFAAERPVVERNGTLIMVDDERMPLKSGEVPVMRKVRFRTLGCYPLTGAVESEADTLPAIIQEMLLTRTSERQGRMIDHDASASMEKKKQEGYF